MTDNVNTAIIASGGGTTGDALMKFWNNGCAPEIAIKVFISTKEGAGCIEKAKQNSVPDRTVDFKSINDPGEFNRRIQILMDEFHIQLLIAAGCIHKIFPIPGARIYNTHPAEIEDHGGDYIYALAVHKHVLCQILDKIYRGRKTVDSRLVTTITFYEVTGMQYDHGDILQTVHVKIPNVIIRDLLKGVPKKEIMKRLWGGELPLEEAADRLQKHVLQYEYRMLPSAARMAALKILGKGGK